MLSSDAGNKLFKAPEIILKEGNDRSDIFSFGAIIHYMLWHADPNIKRHGEDKGMEVFYRDSEEIMKETLNNVKEIETEKGKFYILLSRCLDLNYKTRADIS